MEYCPCGSGKSYALCCGALLAGERVAATPEELMRSRYTAYSRSQLDYLQRTMKPPAATRFKAEEGAPVQWLKLEILESQTQGTKGVVDFIAYYSFNNQIYTLRERSCFEREGQQWYYVDGQLKTATISPNVRCPCGSQKKYKKCCRKSV